MKKLGILLILVLVIVGVTLMVSAAPPNAGRTYTVELSGANEVPGPGDPDGSGVAVVTLNPGLGTACWEISYENIGTPFAAHIHVGTADQSGGVVVPLFPPVESGCGPADPAIILEILRNPEGYYVNVHTPEFGAGAIRGQLSQ
jgi:hypothetical protein